MKHIEKLDNIIAKILREYSKNEGVIITADTDYFKGTIKIKVHEKE